MKTKLLLLVLFGWVGIAQGQSLINQSRRLINPTNLLEYDESKTTKTSDDTKGLGKNDRFTIVGEEGDNYKIYFWNWDKNSEEYKSLNYNEVTKKQRFFLIKKSEIDFQSEKIYDRWSAEIGTLIFPFKYRPNDGTFEPTFSLNLTAGTTYNPWLTNKHTFSLLFGVGPSSAKLNKHNIKKSDVVIDGDLYLAAVTLSLNLVYQYDFVQFGISGGIDNLFDNKKYDWKNQGKPWFSFGVGVNLFKSDKTATPSNN